MVSDEAMFLNLTSKSYKIVRNLKEAVEFSRENKCAMEIRPEYVRFIRLMLTIIPGSICTNEMCLSTLRQLKNYLRKTMLQNRMKTVAIFDKLDLF